MTVKYEQNLMNEDLLGHIIKEHHGVGVTGVELIYRRIYVRDREIDVLLLLRNGKNILSYGIELKTKNWRKAFMQAMDRHIFFNMFSVVTNIDSDITLNSCQESGYIEILRSKGIGWINMRRIDEEWHIKTMLKSKIDLTPLVNSQESIGVIQCRNCDYDIVINCRR